MSGPTRLVFIDLWPGEFLDEVAHSFRAIDEGVEAETRVGDVSRVDATGCAFVSPANSFGSMDGGIDWTYSRVMFPGCETAVRRKIRAAGRLTLLGRPYLPVGSAVAVPVRAQDADAFLLSCPTMFLPHDVSGTRNAYHAFAAALHAFCALRAKGHTRLTTLVCPPLCCGYGRMCPRESARQVTQAFLDWRNGVPAAAAVTPSPSPVDGVYMRPVVDHEQPDIFDNREIKADRIPNLMERFPPPDRTR